MKGAHSLSSLHKFKEQIAHKYPENVIQQNALDIFTTPLSMENMHYMY